MRNILKWYHEIIAISVILSSWPGGMATYVPETWQPALSSLPIWAQIVKVNWNYLIKYNNTTIWELELYTSSWYELDDIVVDRGWVETSVTTTPITLQEWDIIYVAFKSAELLLASSPALWYEMVWDGIDSIWFRFTDVYGLSDTYSWEIWIADTDYWMPQYNYLSPLPPELVATEEIKMAMMDNWWNNLYAPWNITPQNTYTNDYWRWDIDFSTYNWTASMAWAGEHFVWLNEWIIIKNMFTMLNLWEDSGWTSLDSYTWVQIPWSYIMLSPYSLVYYDNWNTNLRTDHFYYIPGDYYDYWDQSQFRCVTINDAQRQFPSNGHMELYLTNPNKDLNLWKMRVLNTTKTNYSLAS